MLALVALAPLAVLPFVLWRHVGGWRSATLCGAVVWGALVTALTEALSVFNALTPMALALAWSAICVGLVGVVVGRERSAVRQAHDALIAAPRKLGRVNAVIFIGIVVVFAVTLVIALVAAPNNYDSMTYHMARVAHWAQNASVAHYPTNIPRQLFQSPWAEFAIAHLQILSGGDQFANLIQWLCFVGVVMGASVIARQLGADARGQFVAAALSSALPMAILQSTSTQNDLAAAFWLSCVVHLLLALRTLPSRWWLFVALCGLAVGLGPLTKVTNFVYMLPFGVWLFVPLARRVGFGRWLASALLIGSLALTMTGAHFARNMAWFGTPISPKYYSDENTNQLFTPAALVSNISRNLVLHMATPVGAVNGALFAGVAALHNSLGLDLNDPRTTQVFERFRVDRRSISTHEDYVGSQLQLLLIGFSLLAMVATPTLRRRRDLWAYALCLAAGFVLLSWLVKWMPYNTRYHLPFFALWSPFIAVVLSKLRWAWLGPSIALSALFISIPWLARNTLRPLVGAQNIFVTSRGDQQFINAGVFKPAYEGAATFLTDSGCRDIGLHVGADQWEYPLWTLMRQFGAATFRIRHISVVNLDTGATRNNARANEPCALVSMATSDAARAQALLGWEGDFVEAWRGGGATVYLKR